MLQKYQTTIIKLNDITDYNQIYFITLGYALNRPTKRLWRWVSKARGWDKLWRKERKAEWTPS